MPVDSQIHLPCTVEIWWDLGQLNDQVSPSQYHLCKTTSKSQIPGSILHTSNTKYCSEDPYSKASFCSVSPVPRNYQWHFMMELVPHVLPFYLCLTFSREGCLWEYRYGGWFIFAIPKPSIMSDPQSILIQHVWNERMSEWISEFIQAFSL